MTNELPRKLFFDMLQIRLLDARMLMLHRQGRIGFYGPSIGQESVAAAVANVLQPSDWVVPSLREHGVALIRGVPLAQIVAQIVGNAEDIQRGRQMPSHVSSLAARHVSWSSCVGNQLCHAVGLAFAAKRANAGEVVIGFLGDGATSTPDFHAALNFAGVLNVPCVFVCQNNQFSNSTPAARQTATARLSDKASAYGIAGETLSGSNVSSLHQSLGELVERARYTCKPVLIEVQTFRIGPHTSSDDPARYIPKELLDAAKCADPIELLFEHLLEENLLTRDERTAFESSFEASLMALFERAEHIGPPSLQSMFDDVFASPPWHLQEQLQSLCSLSLPSSQPAAKP
jgi:pyruvate dehydrogenase E1 component alpha subunit/2-oxoisovalerate dehydrogenase E1 component alpha subunit